MIEKPSCLWCPAILSSESESLCHKCSEKEAMLKEGLTTAPEMLSQDDLDRFFWKLSVYAIKGMKLHKGRPLWTLDHVRNSLSIPIVKALPLNYISLMEFPDNDPDQDKLVSFTVKTKIPRSLLFKTVEKLKIWQPIDKDKEEPDNFTGA